MLATAFWISVFIVIYTYLLYPVILFTLVRAKRLFGKKSPKSDNYCPNVTLLIAAYNEEQHIKSKIENCLHLDYPRDKMEFLFVTDGSTDRTNEIIEQHPEVTLSYQSNREGKLAAVQRVLPKAKGDILVFSDANALLNKESIKNLVKHFQVESVGVVSGEKRILTRSADMASAAGEGMYWKYESKLKKWDYELYSAIGAAGELFAIRSSLFEPVPEDTIIEDFYLSMKIAQKGYIIAYERNAYAMEEPSDSIREELKRKIRIAAGGIQAVRRLDFLLNPFKFGVLTFQYISHRVLRWTLAPMVLPLIFLTNLLLINQGLLYQLLFVHQVVFYGAAILGFLFERKHIRVKLLFIPYYFCMMNFAVYCGFKRYCFGSQSVRWEKSVRRSD